MGKVCHSTEDVKRTTLCRHHPHSKFRIGRQILAPFPLTYKKISYLLHIDLSYPLD
jgi:hypothetical protein